jgi:hypothetical protein
MEINQLLIASDFFEARAATVAVPPEAYLEWADTSPVPLTSVAEELGILPRFPEEPDAAREFARSRAGCGAERKALQLHNFIEIDDTRRVQRTM